MSSRYRELKPISSGSPPYPTSSASSALPLSGLVAETVSAPSPRASLTARLFSVEMVETRSTASKKDLRSTSITLSLPEGITRS
jgi:hypothetical protein